VNYPEDEVRRERGRLRRTAILGAIFPLVALVVVLWFRGVAPWAIPYYHVAIPIALLCVAFPAAYVMMPLFDGVLILGRPRITGPRAALLMRCGLTALLSLLALWVFFHSRSIVWFAVLWTLSLPAAVGIARRIGAYERALDRIASGEAPPPAGAST
jgi:hypothetical protein